MIPKIIHSCWFGRGSKPEMIANCLQSWHNFMPDWEYMEWNEDNFDIASAPLYVRQAYETKRYAFVSDYVRLWALNKYGGLYMDVDFEVFKPFDALMAKYDAFAGIEGSKTHPVMMGVCASKAGGRWVQQMMTYYKERPFIIKDAKGEDIEDFTPNTTSLSNLMTENGFVRNGAEQDYLDLHVFPTEYFSPQQTTGEYLFTENTYCATNHLDSWPKKKKLISYVLKMMPTSWRIKLITIKRKIMG